MYCCNNISLKFHNQHFLLFEFHEILTGTTTARIPNKTRTMIRKSTAHAISVRQLWNYNKWRVDYERKKAINYFQDLIIDTCKSFSSLCFESQFQNYNITSKLIVCQGKELLNSSNFVLQSRNKLRVISFEIFITGSQ